MSAFLFIPPITNYSVPDQSIQYEFVQRINLLLKLNHNEHTFTPPANHFVLGEGRLHTNPLTKLTSYYQPAFELVTEMWDVDPDAVSPSSTDYHFKLRYLKLSEDQTTLEDTVDLHAKKPTVSSLSKTFYRNACHQNGLNLSANNQGGMYRHSSSDGLRTNGRRPLCFLADIMGDCFGVEIVGNWAVPLVSGNQCWAFNLVTGERVERLGFTTVGAAIASLELTTDPLDPPWGQGYADHPFTAKMFNVMGSLDSETIIVQEVTQDFTIETMSAFGEQTITKTLAPLPWINPPGPSSPSFSWPLTPYTGDGTWEQWWVRDPFPSGKTSIDTVADDAVYDVDLIEPGVQPSSVGFSTPAGLAGFAKFYPGSAIPPIRAAEAAPFPDDYRNFRTLPEIDTQLTQMQADITTAAAPSVWRGWRQKSEKIEYLFLNVADFSVDSTWDPQPGTATEPNGEGIVRGPSIFTYETGAEDLIAQREDQAGYYKPNPRTPPAGYKGGGESVTFSLSAYGQFGWYTSNLTTGGRTQYGLFSTSSGTGAAPGSPPGIYIPYGTGAPTPLAPGTLGWTSAALVTIFAPIPEGIPTGSKPFPFHGTKFVTDGTRVIFLPRDSTFWQHANDLYVPGSEDEATENLHKIVCIRRSGGAWVVDWALDTYKYMGPAVNAGGVRLHASGDCRSNGILTGGGFLYCVLFGGAGERLVAVDITSGGVVGFTQLSDPGFHLTASPLPQVGGLEIYHDNLVISKRAPVGIGFNDTWWRLKIKET